MMPIAKTVAPGFVPVHVERPRSKTAHTDPPIRIELRKDGVQVLVE